MNFVFDIRKSKKRDFVENFTLFFANTLKLERFNSTCIVRTYQNFTREHDSMGGVCFLSPTEFEIGFDSRCNGKDILLCLSHELVHVQQMAMGHLRYVKGIPYWLGERSDGIPYDQCPWEIRAYTRMIPLIEKLYQVYTIKFSR